MSRAFHGVVTRGRDPSDQRWLKAAVEPEHHALAGRHELAGQRADVHLMCDQHEGRSIDGQGLEEGAQFVRDALGLVWIGIKGPQRAEDDGRGKLKEARGLLAAAPGAREDGGGRRQSRGE